MQAGTVSAASAKSLQLTIYPVTLPSNIYVSLKLTYLRFQNADLQPVKSTLSFGNQACKTEYVQLCTNSFDLWKFFMQLRAQLMSNSSNSLFL